MHKSALLYIKFKHKTKKKYHNDLKIIVRIFYAMKYPTIINQLTPIY